MAKLMVCIDFPDISYYDLRKSIDSVNRKAETYRQDGFFTAVDEDKVVVDITDLKRSLLYSDEYERFVFELIGCKP